MNDSSAKKGLIVPMHFIYKIKTGVGYCVSLLFPFFLIQKMGDNENPAYFIHEIKTKGYDVIGVNVFLPS